MFNLDRFLDKPVDVKAIIDRLEFDPDDVEKAAVEQPRMLLEASRFKLQCFDRRQKRSRSRATFRRELPMPTKKKPVKKGISEQTGNKSAYLESRKAYLQVA